MTILCVHNYVISVLFTYASSVDKINLPKMLPKIWFLLFSYIYAQQKQKYKKRSTRPDFSSLPQSSLLTHSAGSIFSTQRATEIILQSDLKLKISDRQTYLFRWTDNHGACTLELKFSLYVASFFYHFAWNNS
jgi:hypothetical protein